MTTAAQRKPPVFLRGGDPDDPSFLSDPRRRCRDQSHLYFSVEPDDHATCRSLCARCPVFQQCARYGLAHFDDFQVGVMFGLTETQRRRVDEGLEVFWDWRREWNWSQYVAAKFRAKQRANRRKGVSKREQHLAEMPICPACDSATRVIRSGRTAAGRQRYRCEACKLGPFLEG